MERALEGFFNERLTLAHGLPCIEREDLIAWFLPKRTDAALNRWLQASKLSVLTPLSPQGTGCLTITRERIDHVRERRDNQHVGIQAVQELFQALFVAGGAALAPNQSSGERQGGYDRQLMMFRDSYKSRSKEVAGQSPAAVLGLDVDGTLVTLRIETAYWMHSRKAEALRKGAL